MALDSDGRPIPVSTPAPAPPPSMPEEIAQLNLNMRKADDALRQLEDISRRVNRLEQGVDERVNAAIIDFGKRFDQLMVSRIQDFEKRFDTLAAIVARFSATQPVEPPPPPPT